MGKITVENCHIEGLKVTHQLYSGMNAVYFMETYNYNDYKAAGIDMESFRITSQAPARAFSADFISRSTIRRTSLYVL